MNPASTSNPSLRQRRPFASVLVPVLVGTLAAMPPCWAKGADGALDRDIGIAELESAFWACDYAATHGRVDLSTAAVCSQYTEALKARKFDGKFQAMLDWWQLHKQDRHAALAAGDPAHETRTARNEPR